MSRLRDEAIEDVLTNLASWYFTSCNREAEFDDDDMAFILKSLERSWFANRVAIREAARDRG